MRKQLLVSVDRGETRVAILESEGSPPGAAGRGRGKQTSSRRLARCRALHRAQGQPLDRRKRLQGQGRQRPARPRGRLRRHRPRQERFLHADDVVFPGVEVARRGRGAGKGKRITELPGQEILVQAIKDPLKTKGPRLSMQLSIAGRYLVYVPQGRRCSARAGSRTRSATAAARRAGSTWARAA